MSKKREAIQLLSIIPEGELIKSISKKLTGSR
jgi:hypothetical protein